MYYRTLCIDVCLLLLGAVMNAMQHLNQAIRDFELVHQRKPTVVHLDWRTRADLAMQGALPVGMEIINATVEWRVIRVE